MKNRQGFAFPLTILAAALLAAYGPARAEEVDEVKQLITPASEASVGLGYVDNENQQWGKFTGMTENGIYGLVDVNGVKRDDATGTWWMFRGRNLGLDHRDFRFDASRQGDWGLFLEYSQLPFNQPLRIITSTSGIGAPVQNPAGLPFAVPYNLDTRRDTFTAGLGKMLGKGFDVSLRFRDEVKSGDRRWGNQGPNFLAEPIDFETQQLDGVFSYAGEKLQIQAGYYGTSFDNSNSAVYVPTITGTPVSTPPDNESHQGYVTGGYNFTPTTRGNFKVSYTEVTQNEAFFTATTAPAGSLAVGRRSLDGKVETTLAQVGIVSRPLPKLTLRADWRYEDRDDKTPRLQYNTATASRDGFNVPLSRTTNIARGEAQYLLPMGFRIIGGIDYDKREREVTPTLRQVSWREETEEWSYRAELNRALSETINGRLSYTYSDRDGSAYLPANNNAGPDVIDPIHWADRKQDKWRLRLDWLPVEPLSVQFTGDYAKAKYDGRPSGPEKGELWFYGLDATYVVTDDWQAIGWASQTKNEFNTSTFGQSATAYDSGVLQPPTGFPNAPAWFSDLKNTTTAFGLGLRGKATSKLEVGADLFYQKDEDEYNVQAFSGPLPEINVEQWNFNLFGKYALSPKSGVKLEYIYNRWETDDWAWQNTLYLIPGVTPLAPVQLPAAFAPLYTNGTVAYFDTPQHVHFIGVSYYFRWD